MKKMNIKATGETIVFPLHMVKAFDKALNDFSHMGFQYSITDRLYKDSKMSLTLDTTLQEAIALGIKIGYNLKAEENEQPI